MCFLNKVKENIRAELGILTHEEVSKIPFKGKIQQHIQSQRNDQIRPDASSCNWSFGHCGKAGVKIAFVETQTSNDVTFISCICGHKYRHLFIRTLLLCQFVFQIFVNLTCMGLIMHLYLEKSVRFCTIIRVLSCWYICNHKKRPFIISSSNLSTSFQNHIYFLNLLQKWPCQMFFP